MKGIAAWVGAAALVLSAAGAFAQEAPAGTGSVSVLDSYSVWRFTCQLAPPVLENGETVSFQWRWLNTETPPAAEGWEATDFDDQFWARGTALLVPKTALAKRLCVRGKFTVTDPAAVRDLKLTVGYRGGLVVYLNGKEVAREHVAAGEPLADGPVGEERTLTDLTIAADSLQTGANVVGLEIVRASYPVQESGEEVREYTPAACELQRVELVAATADGLVPNAVRPDGFQVWNADILASDYDLDFGDAAEGLRPVVITAARNGLFDGKVIVGSTRPIVGLTATPGDLTGPGGAIPASAVDVRYGIPWGEQALTSETHLTDVAPYTTFPTLLDGLSDEAPARVDPVVFEPTKARGEVLYVRTDLINKNLLGSKIPGHLRLRGGRDYRFYSYPTPPDAKPPVGGAVVPVWLSVRVPADVGAGTYAGSVRIEAEGEAPVDVPVEVRVADWRLPDPDDYRTWVDMIQCPDTLELEYGVERWSDEHFDLIAKSFEQMGRTGCRIVYVPLIAHTNVGNEESMVRWVKKEDGGYGYDFSTMERYLDVAEKHMGTPKKIIFLIWDVYMTPKDDGAIAGGAAVRKRLTRENLDKKGGNYGLGPKVTVLDPATGTTENVTLPTLFETEASTPLWKPLFDELHSRLRTRGLDEAMTFGILYDTWATKDEMAFLKDVAGDVPWAIQSHEGFVTSWHDMDKPERRRMYDIARIGYQARVWSVTFSDDGADRGKGYRGGIESHRGWARADLVALFDRFSRERHPCTRWFRMMEAAITGSQCGLGRLGADYWLVVKDKHGRRTARSYQRYPESDWRNLFIADSMLAPGPNGPVSTNRLEALREGVQDAEAYIVVEEAVTDEALKAKLGEDLAGRCEEYLAARHMMLWLSLSNLQLHGRDEKRPGISAKGWRAAPNATGHQWFLGSGWQAQRVRLYELAGEVQRKLAEE
ncbi:MAG: DUF4091 domain-containing protein [Candidatus Brocadiaceae bacterium]|nr:DUF4091 domain-containing protein [Candidatus Brocadiaceae bacterium]